MGSLLPGEQALVVARQGSAAVYVSAWVAVAGNLGDLSRLIGAWL